jgi:hypothetical protein
MAAVNAWHTARAEGSVTTVAITDEPGVIVDTGHQLALTPVRQKYPAHDVELPQLHRGIALPAPVLALVVLLLGGHQAVTYQDPVHTRS